MFKMPPNLEKALPAEIKLRLRGTELYLDQNIRIEEPRAKPQYGVGSVFILGPARSGTSVMFLALQSALGLSGLGESHVPQIFQRFVYQFYEYARQFSDRNGVLAQQLSVPDFKGYIIQYMRQFYFDRFQGQPFLDKTPGLEALVGAPFLKEAFPAAHVIIMERNGVETIESYRRKFHATFEDAFREWKSCAHETSVLKTRRKDFLFLSQNDLRRDPQIVSSKICAFLKRPECQQAMTEFFSQSREDMTSAPERWGKEMTVDLTSWTPDQKFAYTAAVNELNNTP